MLSSKRFTKNLMSESLASITWMATKHLGFAEYPISLRLRDASQAGLKIRMSPDEARSLAQELVDCADKYDAFQKAKEEAK